MASSTTSQPALPLHLCFFLLTLLMFLGFSWYLNYEPFMESLMDQVKMFLMVSPLLLLLVVHLVSNYGGGGDRAGIFSSLIPLPERESLHRAGGTPWGVGLLLVLLFFMISYQSSFQERWFPLLTR
ncbi:Small heat shock protein HSP [Senna tora]|uniref:Small heat shock protein HSP n=1 Tax=Senna tora TaxID=362788 RepID=A0A834X0L9_9FABA|nr:Small heat shock protein HSP [Senna tora]